MSYSLYTRMTWAATIDELCETFRKWGVRDWSVTPTRPQTRSMYPTKDERTVTLRYTPNGGSEIVLVMAEQQRGQDNLRVLYLAVEAIRKNELRGIGDVVREAYLQLAAPATKRDPYEVLGVRPDTPLEDIDAMYRAKAKRMHPDAGGTEEDMKELNEAWADARSRAGA